MEPAELSRSFSVAWADIPNMNGVNPPNPQFQPSNNVSYITQQTLLPNTTKKGFSPVGLIQSKREPYATEHYFNPYGQLDTKLGTNLGN
jgi:hypothetical protein